MVLKVEVKFKGEKSELINSGALVIDDKEVTQCISHYPEC
jgi:hypothetical protein